MFFIAYYAIGKQMSTPSGRFVMRKKNTRIKLPRAAPLSLHTSEDHTGPQTHGDRRGVVAHGTWMSNTAVPPLQCLSFGPSAVTKAAKAAGGAGGQGSSLLSLMPEQAVDKILDWVSKGNTFGEQKLREVHRALMVMLDSRQAGGTTECKRDVDRFLRTLDTDEDVRRNAVDPLLREIASGNTELNIQARHLLLLPISSFAAFLEVLMCMKRLQPNLFVWVLCGSVGSAEVPVDSLPDSQSLTSDDLMDLARRLERISTFVGYEFKGSSSSPDLSDEEQTQRAVNVITAGGGDCANPFTKIAGLRVVYDVLESDSAAVVTLLSGLLLSEFVWLKKISIIAGHTVSTFYEGKNLFNLLDLALLYESHVPALETVILSGFALYVSEEHAQHLYVSVESDDEEIDYSFFEPPKISTLVLSNCGVQDTDMCDSLNKVRFLLPALQTLDVFKTDCARSPIFSRWLVDLRGEKVTVTQ